MSDNVAEVKISADASGATSGMRQASASVREGVDQIKGHLKGLSDAFGKVNVAMASIGAVLAGGAAFKAAINETVNLTKESNALGKQFGISASEASVLKLALGDVYVSQEAMQSAGNKITQTLRTNEKAFGALGVATRDSNGNLRGTFEVMQDVNTRLLQFKEGTDRNIEGQKIYGRQWTEISGTLKLTQQAMDEAREKATALYLVVGQESVDATKRYRAAMNDVDDVFSAVKKSIGDALLPILSDLGEWLRDVGPRAVMVIRGAMIALGTVFYTFKMIVQNVMDAVATVIQNTVTRFASFGDAAERALHLDGKGALAAWREGTRQIEDNSSEFGKRVVDRLAETREKVADLFGRMMNPETATAAPKAGAVSAGGEKTGGLEAMIKATEARTKYLQQLIRRALADSDQMLSEQQAIESDDIKQREALRMVDLANARDALRARAEVGDITRARELQGEIELEQARYAIEQAALSEREQLARADVVTHNRVANEIELAELQHQKRMTEIATAMRAETQRSWRDIWSNVQGGFTQVLSNFLRGTMTVKDLFRGLASAVVNAITDMVAKTIAQWAIAKVASLIFKKSEMLGDVARAGAGGVASMAAAPFPFNLSAPAFGASMASLAAGYLAIPAAAAGYDIPAGINPLTQLHEREMVLPAKHADVIRGMADNGGGSGGGHTFNITIPAIDGASTQSWLRNGGDRQIADALRRHLKV